MRIGNGIRDDGKYDILVLVGWRSRLGTDITRRSGTDSRRKRKGKDLNIDDTEIPLCKDMREEMMKAKKLPLGIERKGYSFEE